MKLLFVLGSYYPAQSGGPNNTIHWQAKNVSDDLDVTVCATMHGLSKENITTHGIKLNQRSEIEGVTCYFFSFLFHRVFSIRLYAYLLFNIRSFDLVQITSFFFPISWFVALLCIFFSVPFALAPRGELEPKALIYRPRVKRMLMTVFLLKLFKNAKFILTTSVQEEKYVREWFSDGIPIHVLVNYIELSQSHSMSSKKLVEKKGVLYLGRLHPKKGIENLIKAYGLLSPKLRALHQLQIVGSGTKDYLTFLKNLCFELNLEVDFLGHAVGNQKSDLYAKSKVFVLPSYSENFGNVVLEALEFSTPVIASIYTPWEELEIDNCGAWVKNDPEVLAEAIERFLCLQGEEYNFFARNAFNLVNIKYNVHHGARNIEKLYLSNI